MKYDGTGWCKQTAATEEGRRCSCSFTHWCACRPRTKSSLMKVLTETGGQGVRGWSASAEPTKPHHAIPSQSFPPIPHPTLCASYVACIVCFSTHMQGCHSPLCTTHPIALLNTNVKLKPKEVHFVPSSILTLMLPFCPPDFDYSSVWTRTETPFEVAARKDDKRRDEMRKAGHQRKPVHKKKPPVLFVLTLHMCGGVCLPARTHVCELKSLGF